MKGALGQQYVINIFGRGIAQDINHDLPISQTRDTYILANILAVGQDVINSLKTINGDEKAYDIESGVAGKTLLLGLYEMGGYVYTFWGYSTGSTIKVYRDADLIGDSVDFPGAYANGYLYIDGNPNSGELAVTDNDQVPIVLDVDDMYTSRVTTKYNTEYDKTLYEINQSTHLTQPIFRGLNNVGIGGGVKSGSYSYSHRQVSDNGDETPWSPPTPFIPVPSNYGQGGEPIYVPGAKTYGEAASLNQTKYGIDISFRVVNLPGFDYVEVKRIPNNVGAPVEYTATPQYIRLEIIISDIPLQVVDFTDIGSISWATLDTTNTIANSIIATSRTVRFYDGRLVLGGVTYESREISATGLFNDFSDVASQGIAYKDGLRSDRSQREGYTNINNQVYKKSHRLGERYSYAAQVHDGEGSRSFAIPIPDLVNFKFPERRDKFGANEVDYSDSAAVATAATVDSYNAQDTDECYEVYKQGSSVKAIGTGVKNIVKTTTPDAPYSVLNPINREDNKDEDLGIVYCDDVDSGTAYNPEAFNHLISATGMKIAGINTANLPSWARGISILRSEPAGRVVAQGMATYVVSEATNALSKQLDKVWVYSPELDATIGDKPGIFDDIIANPEDYQIQLVSPVGWFPEFYSGVDATPTHGVAIDLVTYATAYYTSDKINPYDVDATTGRGDGYATFGRWRNQASQGAGIDSTLIFDIDSAENAFIEHSTGKDLSGRSGYLELSLGSNLYATNSIATADTSTSANARAFHEPFYVVNIIKNGATVSDSSADTFKEIGHHIKLNSLVGIGTGVLDQSMEITSERRLDYHWSVGSGGAFLIPDESDEYSYILVNNQRWLNVTHWRTVDIDAIRLALDSASSFTQTSDGGDLCETSYGIFKVVVVDGADFITFSYETIAGTDIVPADGDYVEVRYDSTKPIEILLGDTVIGPASFAVLDALYDKHQIYATGGDAFDFAGVAFPFQIFKMIDGVFYSPHQVQNSTESSRYDTGVDIVMDFVRQWLVTFMCESTVNLPFVYKDFFPYQNYIMRPAFWDDKDGDETVSEFMEKNNLYEQYNNDYPDEYLNWVYGGLTFPGGYNFDYNKQHREIYTEKPVGVTELLDYPKRVHWGAKKSAASISKGISLTFPATNIYDLILKGPSEINILYDQYTGKGNNLYTITDQGVIGLITDKRILRDGVSDELGVILSDVGFIQGELWLDTLVGSPDKRWRGRAEGSLKTPQGIQVPGLVFIGDNDIYLLSQNVVASIGTNYRATLVPIVAGITDSTLLTSTFEQARNELWTKIGDDIHIYGFALNNWVARQPRVEEIVGLIKANIYGGTRTARIAVANIWHAQPDLHLTSIHKSHSAYTWSSDLGGSIDTMYAEMAVTPPGLTQFEFTDIFVASTVIPRNILVATTAAFTDPYSVDAADIKNINGLYRVTLGRTTGGNTLIGNTLYVRITFLPNTDVILGYVKTGFKEPAGG